MVVNAAPIAPRTRRWIRRPGAGASEDVVLANWVRVMPTSGALPWSAMMYSMTRFWASKGAKSSKPRDFTAILTFSASLIPSERCCFRR